jgi:hypothetical protein
LPRGTGENHEKSQDIQSPGPDLNLGLVEYERVLTIRAQLQYDDDDDDDKCATNQ